MHALRFVVLLASATLLAGSARAEFVLDVQGTATSDGAGGYLYTYTVTGDSANTLYGYYFSIDVPVEIEAYDISGPEGWLVAYEYGVSEKVVWDTNDGFALLYPGDALEFSFRSRSAPGATGYLGVGADDFFEEFGSHAGQVVGPGGTTAVPEPASLSLLALGAVVAAWRIRAGRRSPDS
ncbi:PEP-CTERM sorting domain-containing protein [Paludisphaera sp.]|uniref:PEP-CTERM sorting domain-containing protein n=1 Tax=Paludisphaera sp. TaxID=2017432 RepID=UPI00301B95D4